MIDKKLFEDLKTTYKRYTKLRDKIIVMSRDVLRNSKQAIFAMHRDEMENAAKSLQEAESKLLEIEKFFKEEEMMKYEGSYKACVEEYVEAKLLYEYLKTGNVELKNPKVSLVFDDYLGGICDLTGEILRKSVQAVTKGEIEKVHKYQETVQDIAGELVQYDLLGKLRSKYDAVKRNLRRIEEISYDLKIREK